MFLSIVLFAMSLPEGAVPAPGQTTVSEVVQRFSADLPSDAPDAGEWSLVPFSSTVRIDSPVRGNLLDELVVRLGFCPPTGRCEFRLSALYLVKNPGRTDTPAVLRYLMERDGKRAEGYARLVPGTDTSAFFRRQGTGPWESLDSEESITEQRFVMGTRHYVQFWHAALRPR